MVLYSDIDYVANLAYALCCGHDISFIKLLIKKHLDNDAM